MQKLRLTESERMFLRSVVQEILPDVIHETIKKVFACAREQRESDKKKLFREVEELLRAKETLEDNVAEWKLKVSELERGINTSSKSRDIVMMSTNRLSESDVLDTKILHLRSSIERDEEKLQKLAEALELISDDRWFDIIAYRYYQDLDDFEIAEHFMVQDESGQLRKPDVRTIRRNKNKLIQKMAVKMFGGEMI